MPTLMPRVVLSDAHSLRQVGIVADDHRRVAYAQEGIPQQARRQKASKSSHLYGVSFTAP